jgi:membrane peptidoglycan carboxypeptidase
VVIGFDPTITVGVWVGYDEKKPLGRTRTGAVAALPIWMDFMKASSTARADRHEPTRLRGDGNIVFVKLDNGIDEAFINGTQPQARPYFLPSLRQSDDNSDEGRSATSHESTRTKQSETPLRLGEERRGSVVWCLLEGIGDAINAVRCTPSPVNVTPKGAGFGLNPAGNAGGALFERLRTGR